MSGLGRPRGDASVLRLLADELARAPAGPIDETSTQALGIIKQNLQQMFRRKLLVPFAQCQLLGRLHKPARAFGIFLKIHHNPSTPAALVPKQRPRVGCKSARALRSREERHRPVAGPVWQPAQQIWEASAAAERGVSALIDMDQKLRRARRRPQKNPAQTMRRVLICEAMPQWASAWASAFSRRRAGHRLRAPLPLHRLRPPQACADGGEDAGGTPAPPARLPRSHPGGARVRCLQSAGCAQGP